MCFFIFLARYFSCANAVFSSKVLLLAAMISTISSPVNSLLNAAMSASVSRCAPSCLFDTCLFDRSSSTGAEPCATSSSTPSAPNRTHAPVLCTISYRDPNGAPNSASTGTFCLFPTSTLFPSLSVANVARSPSLISINTTSPTRIVRAPRRRAVAPSSVSPVVAMAEPPRARAFVRSPRGVVGLARARPRAGSPRPLAFARVRPRAIASNRVES